MRHITAKQLNDEIAQGADQPAPLLLDVREPWEYQICHIEGSTLIPMGTVPEHVQELDKDQEIVVICHHGMRSMQVAYFLEHEGFTNVVNLTGGIDAWAHEVDTGMPKY